MMLKFWLQQARAESKEALDDENDLDIMDEKAFESMGETVRSHN